MTVSESKVMIDLSEIIESTNLSDFRLSSVFSHCFSNSQCSFAITHKESVLLILYYCSYTSLTTIPSYDTVVLEFPSESGSVCFLVWITPKLLLIGFSSGYVMIFSHDGNCLFESQYFDSGVASIRVVSEGEGLYNVWILFDQGNIVALSLDTNDEISIGQIFKYKLIDHNCPNDFVLSPRTTFKLGLLNEALSASVSIYVCGLNPALSSYQLGCPQQFQHFGKLANYVKEKVVHAFSKSIRSIFDTLRPTAILASQATSNTKEYDKAVASVLDISDSKRRVLRMLIDSKGDIVAMSDSLGRVLLYDLKLNCIIRMWKGVRDARLAWSNEGFDESSTSYSLMLAIYAPQIGILSFYGMRHGPLLKNIPLGLNCHIFGDLLVTSEVPKYVCFIAKYVNGTITIHSAHQYDKITNKEQLSSNLVIKEQSDSIDFDNVKTITESSKGNLLELIRSCDSALSTSFKSYNDLEIEVLNLMSEVNDSWVDFWVECYCWIQKLERNLIFTKSPKSMLELNGFSLELHKVLLNKLFEFRNNKVLNFTALGNLLDAFALILGILQKYNAENTFSLEDCLNDITVWAGSSSRQAESISWLKNSLFYENNDVTLSPKVHSLKNFTLFVDLLEYPDKFNTLIRINYSPKTSNDSQNLQLNLCSLIAAPLFMNDAFILPSFEQATRLLCKSSIGRLSFVIQIFVRDLQVRPKQDILRILSNPLPSLLFQRWLRDNLLSIQTNLCDVEIKDSVEASIAAIESEINESGNSSNLLETYSLLIALKDVGMSQGSEFTLSDYFDNIISFYLKTTFLILVNSRMLNESLASAAIIIGSLISVSEQLERRTYNSCSLRKTISEWEELYNKIRVALLFSAVDYGDNTSNISVNDFDCQNLSIYPFLASDSLGFAWNAVEAEQHESRCLDVSFKNSDSTASRQSLENMKTPEKAAANIKWYHDIDFKWKDILSIAEISHTSKLVKISSSKVHQQNISPQKLQRRPILLYFPYHNVHFNLSCHRTLILSSKFLENPSDLNNLTRLLSHLLSITNPNYKALLAVDIIESKLAPLLSNLIKVDNDPSLLRRLSKEHSEFMALMANSNFVVEWSTKCLDLFFKTSLLNLIPANNENKEIYDAVWPTTDDFIMKRLVVKYNDNKVIFEKILLECQSCLIVVQLRSYCRLRQVKLSSILNIDWLSSVSSDYAVRVVDSETITIPNTPRNQLKRVDFIKCCLRYMLPSLNMDSLYIVATRWGIEKDAIRLLLIAVILEKPNLDHLIEGIVNQVSDTSLVVDVLMAGLRTRVGVSIMYFDKLPKFGPVLSTLDSDIVSWVRGYNPGGNIDRSKLDSFISGSIEEVTLDVKSTKQVVLLLQNLLKSDRISKTENNYLEKKIKCDGLLELCDALLSV